MSAEDGSRMTDSRDFPAGTALVAGGSGGIGAAICEHLARAGADVALSYHRNEAAARTVAETVRALGRRASMASVSLEDASAVNAWVESANDLGPIHTVIYAAGPPIPMRYVSAVSPVEWEKAIAAEVHGFFHLAHAALPRLREAKGSIVAVTSAGLARYPAKDVLSVAPKAAVEALVRALASEEGKNGVRANSVAVGAVEAGMFLRLRGGELDAAWVDAARRNTALRRFGTAAEVAEAVVFLASRRASYITGQRLVVDGGYSV